MRTRSEKMLLMLLALVAFFCANFFAYRWLAGEQSKLKLSEAGLKAEQAEAQVLLEKADLWAKRKQWIKDHQPSFTDEGEAKAQVLDHVRKVALDNKLEVQQQTLGDLVEKSTAGAKINISMKVKGSGQNIGNWLTTIEKPEDFYAVSKFSLVADQDLKSYICTVQIARYYKAGP